MVPYRDVFLHKTPMAALLGAVGAALASAFGALPVHGAHAAFLALGAAGAAVLYLLCRHTLPPLVATAAAVGLFAFDQWPLASVEGVRAQVATVTLGLGCLLLAERGRFAASGVLGGAATLCWQPAIAFLVGALCALRPVSRSDAVGAVVRFGAGTALPVLALVGWFAATGALGEFFAQAVGFNLHYISLQAKTPARTVAKMAGELGGMNALEPTLLPFALYGLSRTRKHPPVSLTTAGALYFAMTFLSFQAWPDTILFGPPLAALLAAGLTGIIALVLGPRRAPGVVLALALIAAATPSAARLSPPVTFAQQRAAMQEVAAGLTATDTVVAVSVPEFLLHTDRKSRWPWPYLWFGVDRLRHGGRREASRPSSRISIARRRR
jgi:hypothetical protein